MSHHHSHINTAVKIIASAVPGEPLAYQLKKFFSTEKKYGSKDRKTIAALCYNYYRLGHALKEKTTEEKILAAAFLCGDKKSALLEKLASALNEKINWPLEKKLAFLEIAPEQIFPFAKALSAETDATKFTHSFFRQPKVFLRIRPGRSVKVLEKLAEAKIDFEEISTSCIALPPASKAAGLLKMNKDVVVQDRSSQQVFDFLLEDRVFLPKAPSAWDCCAASGGKSILIYDLLHHHAQLHVSDVRENILHNLRNRFKDAGIKNYHSFIADLTAETIAVSVNKYDIVVCDAPCTGSGTWARTPEQLYFFNEADIDKHSMLQNKIALAASSALKPGGLFFYITCSVFKKENEDVVEYLKSNTNMQLLQMQYIKGYESRADTMFAAIFTLA